MKRVLEYSLGHSTAVIVITICITVFFGFALRNLKFDPTPENLVPESNEMSELFEKYSVDSESNGLLLMAIEADDIFNIEGLRVFEEVIGGVVDYPGIVPVLNPFDVIAFKKIDGRLAVESMSKNGRAPLTEEDLALFRDNILGNPFFENVIISNDGTMLCAVFESNIPTDKIEDFMFVYNGYKKELERFYTVYTTGDIPISARSNFYMKNDLVKVFSFALVFMLACFYVGFKSKRAIFLPMSVVIIGMIWTLGFMALMGYEINLVCLAIPPLVLTIGSSYTIHILNQYFLDAKDDCLNDGVLLDVIFHIGKTILLACLTTVIGFMSLWLTSLEQTRQFGLSTSFGIFVTMILSVFYLPAVLSKLPIPSKIQHENITSGIFSRLMLRLGLWVCKMKSLFIIVFAVIIGVFLFSYNRIPSQEDYFSYFPDNDFVISETSYIVDKIGGYQTVNVSFTAPNGEKNYFLNREVLRSLSKFEKEIVRDPNVTTVSSLAFYFEELGYILDEKRDIPESRGLISLISRYLKMIRKQWPENVALTQLSNDDFSCVTITFRVINNDNKQLLTGETLRDLVIKIEDESNKVLKELNPEVWGAEMRFLYLFDLYRSDQIKSILFAIVLVFINNPKSNSNTRKIIIRKLS